MGKKPDFPSLRGWEPTRDTLHSYVQAISSVPRALAEPHPKWWHISLKVQDFGASTDPIPHPAPSVAEFQLHLDLKQHAARVTTNLGESRSVSLADNLSAAQFGDRVLAELEQLGVRAQVDRERFADDAPRRYDREHAGAYRQALVSVNQALLAHRQELAGETGPVQLWPHNFDLAFEWFGSKTVTREEQGVRKDYPSQINFGFAPGDSSHPAPYFYSNPWPFSEKLTRQPLPHGARWHTASWKGSLLPYQELVEQSADKLREYFRTVYELASPLLTD